MHHHYVRGYVLAVALGAMLSLKPNTLWSAENVGSSMTGVLEEIVVTARRRDESSMDVPMAITLIDGATLENLQFRDIDEFLELSPGVLVYTGSDGVSSQITIRGVVTPGQLVEPGNAVYVDEVYASGMRTVLPGFYDIESVQVLKGPQAGLYGRNTTGGAVVITTRQPTDELSARLDASYADFDAEEVNGTLNLPLSDTVRLRATGWYNDRDGGYYESGIFDQNLDAAHQSGGRLTLAVLPNERTQFALTGEFAEIEESGFTGFAGVVEGARFGPAPLAPESRHNVLRDEPGGLDQDFARINGKLEFDTAAGSFTAVAGWREITAREPGSDLDGTAQAPSYADFVTDLSHPFAILAPMLSMSDDRDTSLNAEVRFLSTDNGGPLRTLIGVSYFEETARLFNQVTPVRDLALIMTAIGQDGSFERRTDQDTQSWASFGELIWTPMATIEITADLRYTSDKKDIDSAQSATGLYSLIGLASTALDTSDTFKNWSPGITLAYQPYDMLTVFGKYVRGFRAGGFNTLVNHPALLPYESEEAENYELGFKALLLERRLELGASVFYLRIDNALVPQEDPGELTTFYPLQNGGIAETTGLEVDLGARVTDGLSLTASAGAYDFSLLHGGPGGLDRRPFVPEYTASLVADYEHPLTATITGMATLGFRHRSGGRVVAFYELDMDSYNLLDAQLGIRIGTVEIAGFVRNALDDHYVVGNYGLALWQTASVGATGLDPLTTRAIVRDPGAVFGIRMTVIL